MNILRLKRIPQAFALSSLVAMSLAPAYGTTQEVAIQNFAFAPSTVTINVGDTVNWTQKDSVQHTSTSDASPPTWDSGLLSLNKTFSFTFNTAGSFPYHCTPHISFMKGSVTVQSVTITNSGPSVKITSPGVGAVYASSTAITFHASATETNGSIEHIEYFAGTNSLGTSTQSPYSLTWSNVPRGTYAITARAFDTNNGSGVSPAINVVVTDFADYVQHNLVSDLAGMADNVDTNLLNPWGIATSATSPFWISANHSGLSTLYDTTGAVQSLVVTIPLPAAGTPPSAPTGIIFNSGAGFEVTNGQPAHFIFSSEDGTITAWSSGSSALLMVDNSASNAIYKGLAIANNGSSNALLYATDFHNGKVDVFDSTFKPVIQAGAFTDTNIPAGYAPFGIQTIGTNLYVTYAHQDADAHDDSPGAGHGFVDIYDTGGNLVKRLISNGVLNSPWGIVMAPEGFGPFSGALLIGNFGDGRINAFDPASGALKGTLMAGSSPLAIEGLWALQFGNGGRGGDANRLYFTAGISGGGSLEDHGLFGSISAAPALVITSIMDTGTNITFNWMGGSGSYQLQKLASVTDTNWVNVSTTTNLTTTAPKDTPMGFYRIQNNPAPAAQ